MSVAAHSREGGELEHGRFAVTILSTISDLVQHGPEWDEFVERVGSDIYFTADWLCTWWTHYGQGRTLRCFLIKADGQPVAALPFMIDMLGIAPFSVKVAKFVGADFTIPVFNPAIAPDMLLPVLECVCGDLMVAQGCDIVSFSPLSGESALPAAAARYCAQAPVADMAFNEAMGVHTMFTLPSSFDAYFKSLSKQTRSNYRRDMKGISAKHQVIYKAEAGPQALPHMRGFIDLHERQWVQTGRLGHFGDWPGSRSFNEALAEAMAKRNRLCMNMVVSDGDIVSYQYGYLFAATHYWRLPARNTDGAWEKIGLGRIALVQMIDDLIGRGVTRIEAGPGHYQYKVRHGGNELPLTRLVLIRRNNRLSRIRVRCLVGISRLLDFLYYRIWFLKIAPRLPLPRRPLARIWIRTRL